MEWDDKLPSGGSRKSTNPFPRKNKCQFCAAYFIDEESCAFHSEKCVARLSAFLASDGRIKFACMVCRDVFNGPTELDEHEQLHKYPGGFGCAICNDTFLNETDRIRHTEEVHKIYECHRCENGMLIPTEKAYIGHCEREHNGESGYATCLECGASFEEKSHLRFHSETKCGHFRGWTCIHCAAIFQTENALSEHMESHTPNEMQCRLEDDNVPQIEFASTGYVTDLLAPIENDQFYDLMSIDQNKYSEYTQTPETNLNKIKEEAFDDGTEMAEMVPEENIGALGLRCANEAIDTDENGQNENEQLEQHKQQIQAKYTCDKCGHGIMRKMDLIQHFASDCGRRPVHECVVCKKSFDTADKLRAHRVSHTGNEFVCEICGKSSRTYHGLNVHWRMTHRTSKVVPKVATKSPCKYCDKSFPSIRELTAHVKTHASSPACYICGFKCETLMGLTSHLTVHIREKPFQCQYCDQKFLRRFYLMGHESKHTGIKAFECMGCSERFATFSKLQSHRVSESTCSRVPLKTEYLDPGLKLANKSKKDKNSSRADVESDDMEDTSFNMKHAVAKNDRMNSLDFVCGICDRKYAFEGFLKKHTALHGADGKLVHKCECCPKYFATVEEKDQHRTEVHSDVLTCPQCQQMFINRLTLKTHIALKHEKKWQLNPLKYICSKCGANFRRKLWLEVHENTDCGRIPKYKCAECGKCLSNEYTYQVHLKMHRDDSKPFICTVCGKGWRSKHAMIQHMRYHTGEKPYACSHCEKRFTDRTSMKTHESTHTGIKPYMCQCGNRFSCISNLQSHRRARKTTCGLLPLISKAFPQIIPSHTDSAEK